MKKLITILSLAVVGFTSAQEQEPTFTVSGSIDAYFRANLTSSNDGGANTILGEQGDFSAFNNDSGFSLGLANINFSYEGEKVGFVADLARVKELMNTMELEILLMKPTCIGMLQIR